MGLDHIYCVDHKMDLGDEPLVRFLKKKGVLNQFQEIVKEAQSTARNHSKFLDSHSLREELLQLNNSEFDGFNKTLYTEKILNLSDSIDSPVLSYVVNWFKRNLQIKSNIDKKLKVSDRALVIIGSGHRAILRDLYRGSEKVEYVEISKYLIEN